MEIELYCVLCCSFSKTKLKQIVGEGYFLWLLKEAETALDCIVA